MLYTKLLNECNARPFEVLQMSYLRSHAILQLTLYDTEDKYSKNLDYAFEEWPTNLTMIH